MPGGIVKTSKDKVVTNIPARDRLASSWGKAQAGIGVLVLDAYYGEGDGDETVTSPSNAFYKWDGSQFVKISEGEGLDTEGWKLDGNSNDSLRKIGTKNFQPLPFITQGTERARLDIAGNLLVGHSAAARGKIHIRAFDNVDSSHSLHIDRAPSLLTLFAVTNAGRFRMNYLANNLLINGGWINVFNDANLIITCGDKGGQLIEMGSHNVVIGYNAGSGGAGGANVRNIFRNVIIGSSAGCSDLNGTNMFDTVVIGYGALKETIGLNGALRSVFIGSTTGSGAIQSGFNHTAVGYDVQIARPNTHNTLIGSGTRAYNGFGDLITNDGSITYATAIGAGAIVRTSNTIVLGRENDNVIIGGDSSSGNAKLEVNATLIEPMTRFIQARDSGSNPVVFEVDREGILSMREQAEVPVALPNLARLFFHENKLKFIDAFGVQWIVQAVQPEP